MILSDRDLRARLASGSIVVEPLDDPDRQIQPASLDLRLGCQFRVAVGGSGEHVVIDVEPGAPFRLLPGQFALATTVEWVRVPSDLVARVEGRSSIGRLGDAVQVKQVSFSGCLWDQALAHGETTSPGRCLPGEDRVHFQKFDAAEYCQAQAKDGTIDGVCPCKSSTAGGSTIWVDAGLTNVAPIWFNYQTLAVFFVDYGDLRRIELRLGELEQDFSVPGPYGH
jgi:hypothetical protein